MITTANMDDFEILFKLDKHVSFETLKKKIKDKEMLVLIEDEMIVGWLRYNYFWDIYPFMNMLYIIDDYRGKGLGRKLVCFWETRMRKIGYEFVMTSTLSNEEAQHFYRKLGYEDIGGFILPHEPLEILLIKQLHKLAIKPT